LLCSSIEIAFAKYTSERFALMMMTGGQVLGSHARQTSKRPKSQNIAVEFMGVA
jgi:hypothetical protein